MLLIQSVILTWRKDARGGQAAAARTRFPPAYPVDERAFSAPPGGAAVQTLRFFQNGAEIRSADEQCRRALQYHLTRQGLSPARVEELISRRQREMWEAQVLTYPDYTHLDLTNLIFRPDGDGWAVSFRWDTHRGGLPYRRGRNQDYNDPDSRLYRCDCLNEPAFRLAPGQYGRIVWNERRRDFDDGTWYYQLHIRNIAAVPDGAARAEVFLGEPDHSYRQMAELY